MKRKTHYINEGEDKNEKLELNEWMNGWIGKDLATCNITICLQVDMNQFNKYQFYIYKFYRELNSHSFIKHAQKVLPYII